MRVFAYSSLCCKYIDDVILTALKNKYKAIEWDFDFIPPTLCDIRIKQIISDIKKNNLQIRYHLPHSYIEIAHPNSTICNLSVRIIKSYLEFIHNIGGEYAILHVGYLENSIFEVGIKKLTEIASFAKSLNIKICVENLIRGLTTNINFLKEALLIDNVFFSFDTGHAKIATKKDKTLLSGFEYLLKSQKCVHGHLYLSEDEKTNHLAFSSTDELEEVTLLEELLLSNCQWLTMELDRLDLQKNQIRILENYCNRN